MINFGKTFGLALYCTLVPCFNAESSSYSIDIWKDILLEENPDQVQKEEIRKKRKISFDKDLSSHKQSLKRNVSHTGTDLSKQVLSTLQDLDTPLTADILEHALFNVLSVKTLHDDSLAERCKFCAINIMDNLSEKTRHKETRRKGLPLQRMSSTQVPASPTKKKLRKASSGNLGIKSKDLAKELNSSITDLQQRNLIAPINDTDLPQPYTMAQSDDDSLNGLLD